MASIDRRPNGAYRARWREYPGGPQRTRSFARKVDARRFLTSVEHSQLTGTYVAPEAGLVSVRDFAEIHLARTHWRPATMATARASLEHALKVLGDRPVASVRRGDVQALLAGLSLAPGTVRNVRQHLGAVFAAAVEDDLISRSPVARVKVPSASTGEIVPPTSDQVGTLLDVAETWFRPMVVLGAGLGLRQAEASGLTVDRIDWMRQTVRIDRQWSTKAHPWHFAPPKTVSSIRSIPAAATVLAELGAHVDQRHQGFLVELPSGGAVDHNRFGVAWRATRKRAGLGELRYHDLRHHFASCLISAGCSVRAVQHALGHGSASTTLNTYAHLWPGDEDRIRAAVDSAFSPAEDQVRTVGHS